MTRENATKVQYQEVELFDKMVLFFDGRIDKKTVPDGVHLYEIRHADDDWSEPVEIAKGILANFYGTIFSREEFQLNPEGYKIIEEKDDFCYTDTEFVVLNEYIAGIPPLKMEYPPIQESDYIKSFTNEMNDKHHGCIGHLRGDFGSGKEFFTTWFNHRPERNTPAFRAEFDRVIHSLRRDELKDRGSLTRHCTDTQNKKLPAKYRSEPEFLRKYVSGQYEYYLRMNPRQGEYNFYLYCYDTHARSRPTPTKQQAPKKKQGQER